jgi:lysophospholipase L1-like esterase
MHGRLLQVTKGTLTLLVLSLAANVLAALTLGRYVAIKGVEATAVNLGLMSREAPDLAQLARERYGGLPGAEVVIFGDSHVQDERLSEIVPGSALRGIEGQTIADASTWVEQALYANTRRLIVMLGTNDAVRGRTREQAARDYHRLIADVERLRPDVTIAFVTAPPVVRREAEVAAVNAALVDVGQDANLTVVDIVPLVLAHGTFDPRYTVDGTHLSGRGHARIAPLIRQAARDVRDQPR